MSFRLSGLLLAALGVCGQDSSSLLWYRAPAANWNEALPIGNGRLGAMVFGDPARERLQLNDDTLWSGAPGNWNNPAAKEVLPLVRKAVLEGRYHDADALSKKMQGPYTESYMPMADLEIEFEGAGAAEGYRRSLDLARAVHETTFEAGGVKYTRTAFSSAPDQTIVVRLEASAKRALTFTARLTSKLRFAVVGEKGVLILRGKAPKHVEPNYRWQFKDAEAIQYDERPDGEGMRFEVRLLVKAEGGKVAASGSGVTVTGASAATLLIAAATSYNGYDKSPGLQGREPGPIASSQIAAAAKRTYADLLSRHAADYGRYYSRFSIDLGSNEVSRQATDERLRAGIEKDPALLPLLVQYARYLLISSSRPGTQPANLKGIWNDRLRPEWSANWTLDHDAQMSYYPVETLNLAEMHEPFLEFADGVAANGRETARINYGARGWCAHHNADIWRQSGPAGDWGDGNPHWALFPFSGIWLAQHYWEHYEFTQDREYLKRAWPVLRGAAEFALDWIQTDEQGRVITNPSVSPENSFVAPDGKPAQISIATTVDMSLLWELFTSAIDNARILGVDDELAARMKDVRARLRAPGIGKNGRLMEWSEDWESTDPGHRHLSHLFGVFPGRQFSPRTTPEIANGAKVSLRARDASDYGWSLAWKAACWARLGEGDEAYDRLRRHATYCDSNAKKQSGGWLYPNLFNADPPWTILNGNPCIAAAVAEMIVQSHQGEIEILPALPRAMSSGRVKGMRARGGFTVAVEWAGGEAKEVRVKSLAGNECRLRVKSTSVVTWNGRRVETRDEGGALAFATQRGAEYVVRPR